MVPERAAINTYKPWYLHREQRAEDQAEALGREDPISQRFVGILSFANFSGP
jgi:hypothetical protein